jgi:hypothetical protein
VVRIPIAIFGTLGKTSSVELKYNLVVRYTATTNVAQAWACWSFYTGEPGPSIFSCLLVGISSLIYSKFLKGTLSDHCLMWRTIYTYVGHSTVRRHSHPNLSPNLTTPLSTHSSATMELPITSTAVVASLVYEAALPDFEYRVFCSEVSLEAMRCPWS